MERAAIRAEERTGLAVAVILHLALFAMLFVQGLFPAPTIDPPQRMTVSLAEDVGMQATAPDPVTESRASAAPTLDINPAPAPAQELPVPPQAERPVLPARTPGDAARSAAHAKPAASQSAQRGLAPRRQFPRRFWRQHAHQ